MSPPILDRLPWFQRQAEVLAALNHPNVAAVYGLEKTSDLTALAMELVEGDELCGHIARGPIQLADALRIAKQIADALEAAHEQGIVHRELAAPRGPRGVRSCFLHQCPLYRSQRRFRSPSALDRVAVDVMWGGVHRGRPRHLEPIARPEERRSSPRLVVTACAMYAHTELPSSPHTAPPSGGSGTNPEQNSNGGAEVPLLMWSRF